MAEVEQQPTSAPSSPKKRRILRSFLLTNLDHTFITCCFHHYYDVDRPWKSFLLDRVLQAQQVIKYEYEGGNLLRGIILKNIIVQLKKLTLL